MRFLPYRPELPMTSEHPDIDPYAKWVLSVFVILVCSMFIIICGVIGYICASHGEISLSERDIIIIILWYGVFTGPMYVLITILYFLIWKWTDYLLRRTFVLLLVGGIGAGLIVALVTELISIL
jgi:hypothetical protein